jgi:exosortase
MIGTVKERRAFAERSRRRRKRPGEQPDLKPMSTPSSDALVEGQAAPPARDSRERLFGLLWLLAALILVYWPTLRFLVSTWIENEDMGHGFFVPLVSGYLIWQKRAELAAVPWKRNGWGAVLVAYGAIQMLVGHLGVELFLSRTALLISLAGCVLYLCGWELFKKVAFPLGLLVFMIPIPNIIYNQITFPLQLFASSVAEHVLTFLGTPVLRTGNILELPSQRLSVVEACSGIRSLLALTFLSLTYAALFDPRKWMRVALLLVTVPIAILSNATRVTLTGILSEINPELASGLFHTMEGTVMYAISLVLLFLAHQFLSKIGGGFSKEVPGAR